MDPVAISLVGISLFVILIFLGIPIGFSFACVGFVGIIFLKGVEPGLSILGTAPFSWASQITLVVLPLFILMGQFAFHSGISKELFEAAHKLVGSLPGGLALATNFACTGFAGCTGSSLASASTMATLCYPEMRSFGYSPRLACGTIASGGTLGVLIPPSTLFIVYGVITETSIGKLFMAGIFPGLMLSGLFSIYIYLICKKNPKMGPPGPSFLVKEKLGSLYKVWGMAFLFCLVIGGLYIGIFAPSEAGAIGASGALILVCFKGHLKSSTLVNSLRQTLEITCMIFTILIGAMIFSTFLTLSGLPLAISRWIQSLNIPPVCIVIGILLLYIPLGMVMDSLPMILLTMPTLFPVVSAVGIDPVWFGVLVILMSEFAMLSPPVGMNAYIVSGVTKVSLLEVFKGVLPFLVIIMVGVSISIVFPGIALFLPNLIK